MAAGLKLSDTSGYKKVFLWVVCCLAFSLPFPMVFNNLLVIILTVVWLAGGNFKLKIRRISTRPPLWLFLGLFGILIIGLFTTDNFKDAGSRIERSIPLLLLPLVFFSSHTLQKNQLNIVFKFFVVGCITAMIVCIAVAYYKNTLITYGFEPNIFTIELTFPIQVSHVYFGMYLAFACILSIYIYQNSFPKLPFLALVIILLLMLSFLLTITAKIAFLSLLCIGIVIGLFIIDLKKHIIEIISGLAVLCVLSLILYKNIGHIQRRVNEGFSYSFTDIENNKKNYSSTRMGPLKCSIEIIKENWLLGVGTGDNGDAIEDCYIHQGLDKLTGLNSHNEYIDYLMTFGVVGLILLLGCFFIPLRWAFQKKDYLYASFLLLFILCNLTENMLLRNKGIVFYALFNSLFATTLLYRMPEDEIN